ncbi:sugar ABC transporter permease [Lentzea sp. NBRC 105346]|uniref:carbohydrate ABC transporter permease n=1 Tax=Lentzea sp. NBRC 105346 TaxID=3032205 RepID=UPI0024A15AE9|nr:carbohydrate ABC transporter permease [Lentzea sp. NBRC 105346]GLZ35980.1 sugar ABC transporter permease [Lentzea sp. NBRC 105346]
MRRFLGVAFVVVYLFPVYWMVSASVKRPADLASVQLVPHSPSFDTWTSRILSDPRVLRYVLNSVIVASGTMVLTLALGIPAAYALARLPLRGKPVLMLMMLSSLMFPAIMLATPLFVVFSRLGLTDSYLGLILADTTLALPYSIVLLRPAFAAVPREFGEAALIDGCSAFGVFWRIVVPLVLPGIATVAVLAFLWGWGDLVFALTLASEDSMRPVTTGLWGFFGATTSDWAGAMAFSTVAMLPPLVVFLVSQRLVISGVAAGGTKG